MKNRIIIFYLIFFATLVQAQLLIKSDQGNTLMMVSEEGSVGIGSFSTSNEPLAGLEVDEPGQIMTVESFDQRTLDVHATGMFKIDQPSSTAMGHYGTLCQMAAPIDKDVYTGQLMENSGSAGRVFSRTNNDVVAMGDLGVYEIIMGAIAPNPPDFIYHIAGVRAKLDADEVASDFNTTADGFAAALSVEVEDNSVPYSHVFGLYATGAKSVFMDKVGINTLQPAYDLDVNGDLRVSGDIYYPSNIISKPDYVFSDDYSRLSIPEVQSYIDTHRHLPWVTGADKEKSDVNLVRMSNEMLETIENLQLQVLELYQVIEELKSK